jgi:hypothetical protein
MVQVLLRKGKQEAVHHHLGSKGDHQDDDELYYTGGAGLHLDQRLQYSELDENT